MEKDTRNSMDKNISLAIWCRMRTKNFGNRRTEQVQNIAAAFFIKMLLRLVVFTIVTIILSRGFLFAEKLSREAELLSKAVHLAENTAEIVSISESGEMLFSLLNENENVCVLEQEADVLYDVYRVTYDGDMNPAANGIFCVDVSWIPGHNGLVRSTVSVYWIDNPEALYSLDLSVYVNRLHE